MSTEPTARARFDPRCLVRDWRAWIGAIFALYTIVGFFVVPLVAKHQIAAQVREVLGCEASVRWLRFNPFTFNIRARDFALADRRGDSLATFAELYVNLAPIPALKRVVALEEVRLTDPRVAGRLRADGTLNMTDLMPDTAGTGSGAPVDSSKLWAVRVERLDVQDFHLDVNDATVNPHAHLGIDSLDFTLSRFTTVAGDMHKSVIRPGPDYIFFMLRGCCGKNGTVVLHAGIVLGDWPSL